MVARTVAPRGDLVIRTSVTYAPIAEWPRESSFRFHQHRTDMRLIKNIIENAVGPLSILSVNLLAVEPGGFSSPRKRQWPLRMRPKSGRRRPVAI